MEEENDVTQDSSPEEEEETEEESIVSEDVNTPEAEPINTAKKEKVIPFSRFKEVNDELSRLKKEPKRVVNTTLNVEDYIDISASLEGLDKREKEYLASQHKLTGKPLSEIRKDEDFQLWQSAYQTKREKELSLRPSGTQADSDKPMSLIERLKNATLADKEKLLEERGLWKNPKQRTDRIDLGRGK